MEPIQFSCFGCLATLRVRGELAGAGIRALAEFGSEAAYLRDFAGELVARGG